MNLTKPDTIYRPLPFWSWNEKLAQEETREQVRKMDEAGIGGFFMHARGGLQTEYMGPEWFENVDAAVEEAEKCGMRPWAYDENGWPSGFGNGAVNGMGVAFQQKYLRMESAPTHPDTAICKSGSHYFYYEVNPFYVDMLDKDVIHTFIQAVYEPYFARYGTRIEGFFTDEPQISRQGFPWSFVFEEAYRQRYGENILEVLEQLFLPVGDYKMTRVKFWKMVTDLFSENAFRQIYDWCNERGLKLTGHLLFEESLSRQLTTNGACMPHYEYFHIPGMDWLGRDIYDCLTPMQVSSVAEQLGKEAVISETFALCGHNVSFAELKGIYEWQMVHGINLLCQHLEGYSIRGIRKRDYPPAMYIQQPWWEEYRKFLDAMTREGMLLNSGHHPVEVLLLHPQTTAWALYDAETSEGLEDLNEKLFTAMKCLEGKHIAYHLGDETILQRHAVVENGHIVIGTQKYAYVVDPGCEVLLDSTRSLLNQFQAAGGKIVSADTLPANNVVDNPRITYTCRQCDGYRVHFFVNTSAQSIDAHIAVTGKRLDIDTGALVSFQPNYSFEPWGSLMILEGPESNAKETASCFTEATTVTLEAPLTICGPVANALTLDHCDYYFDDILQEREGYVLNICERANSLRRPVQIHQDYHIRADHISEPLYLVCETPEKFQISINGVPVDAPVSGWYRDKSFKKIEVSRYLQVGANTISFDCNFSQSEAVYQNLEKAAIFESEKNKLAYDMEIEAIYLLGDFRVRTDGTWEDLPRNAVRYHGEFVLDAPTKILYPQHIEQQGFPFFCGKLCLETTLHISGENPILEIPWKGCNAVKVEIASMEKTMLTSRFLPLSDFAVQGNVPVRLTLVNNLRNLLGPHHLPMGESYYAGPYCFYKEPCVWNWCRESDWDDGYCFAVFSLG